MPPARSRDSARGLPPPLPSVAAATEAAFAARGTARRHGEQASAADQAVANRERLLETGEETPV